MFLIAVVEKFYVFFVRSSDELQTVIDLIFRYPGAVIKVREYGGHCPGL